MGSGFRVSQYLTQKEKCMQPLELTIGDRVIFFLQSESRAVDRAWAGVLWTFSRATHAQPDALNPDP